MKKWITEKALSNVKYSIKIKKSIYNKKSPYQHIEIVDTNLFGKVLALDDIFQTSTKDEFFYHEMLVHPVMNSTYFNQNILIIGGGDGGTLKRVLQYNKVKKVYVVEIDEEVIKVSKRYLPKIVENSWNDPRVELIITDGIEFLKNNKIKFDIIIIDGSDPIGPAKNLIKKEFYKNCKKSLHDHGCLVTQSESPYVMFENFKTIINNIKEVFGKVSPYLAPVPLYTNGLWSYTLAAVNKEDLLKFPIKETEKIEKNCNYYNKNIHKASFILPQYIKKQLNL